MPPPEEEARAKHGAAPVQFNHSSGLPGPMNTNIPAGKTPKGRVPMQRHRNAPTTPQSNGSDATLRRQFADLQLKYARSEAAQIVSRLKDEGIIFGDNPEEAKAAEAETTDYLAYLSLQSEADRDYEVGVIRKRYKRRRPDPATPSMPSLARFARPVVGAGESDEDFEPNDPQEASTLADLMTLKKMSRADAVAVIRKSRNQ